MSFLFFWKSFHINWFAKLQHSLGLSNLRFLIFPQKSGIILNHRNNLASGFLRKLQTAIMERKKRSVFRSSSLRKYRNRQYNQLQTVHLTNRRHLFAYLDIKFRIILLALERGHWRGAGIPGNIILLETFTYIQDDELPSMESSVIL